MWDSLPLPSSPKVNLRRRSRVAEVSTGPDGQCVQCVAGEYKESRGSAECTLCAENTYSSLSVVGATSISTCGLCDHGFLSNTSQTLMRKLLPVGCIRYSLRMGFKTLSFFCPVLGGPSGEAGSAPLRRADRCGVSCRRRSGSSGSPLESGVSPAHIGPSNACHGPRPRPPRYGDCS